MPPKAATHFHEPFPTGPLFCARQTVPEAWIDYNGHMNVGYYGLAFDQAIDVILNDWLDLGERYVEREKMGPFTLEGHFLYMQELRLGEEFEVSFQLLDFDHKRLHYLAIMERAEDGATAAMSEALSMNVDLERRASAPYPERQYARLQDLMDAHKDLRRPPQVGRPIGIRRG